MNNVNLVGRIASEQIELKAVSEKFTVASFSIAVKDKYKKDSVSYINIECYNKLAETITQYCSKGDQLIINGYLKIDSYTDKEGRNRTKAKVIIESFEFGAKKQNLGVNDMYPSIKATPVDDGDMPF